MSLTISSFMEVFSLSKLFIRLEITSMLSRPAISSVIAADNDAILFYINCSLLS